MQRIMLLLLVLLLTRAALVGEDAAAGPAFRIAVLDMKQVFHAHPDTSGAEERVKKSREEARDTFRKKTDALKAVLQQHQEKLLDLDGSSGASAEKMRSEASALLQRARVLEREIAEFKIAQETELQRAFLEEKDRILASITEAVQAFNSDGKYHMILDKSAAAANGMPMVLDVHGLDDISGEIIGRLK